MDLVIVLVLYKTRLLQSSTYQSLIRNLKENPNCFSSTLLIIYDNSPVPTDLEEAVPFRFKYVNNRANGGLAIAYNYAFQEAAKKNCGWLMLLDQDTLLPDNFINAMYNKLKELDTDETVAAITPKAVSKERLISPCEVKFAGRLKPIPYYYKGIYDNPIMAINSGTIIRVSFLEEIGGFNELFKLDYLDHWLFYVIYSNSKKVYIQDVYMKHELSVTDFDKFVTPERYVNILFAEWQFYQLYKSKPEIYIYILKNFIRVIYRLIVVRDKRISIVLLRHCFNIMWSYKDKKRLRG